MSSPFIDLRNVSWHTPDGAAVLENVSLTFGAERTGLVGRNGAGKTTLLRIASGELAPHAGSVQRLGTLGVLRQQVHVNPLASVADGLGATEALARLERVESGAASPQDLADADWTLRARLGEALSDVGLPGLDLHRPLSSLSGGEVTRIRLAALLVARPDVILLDEPTNNLDTRARTTVAHVLEKWRGGAVVASHDRSVLRGMDRIVELSTLGATVFGGGGELYVARKEAEVAVAERELARAERSAEQLQPLRMTVPPAALPAERIVLAFQDAEFRYDGGPAVLFGLSFSIAGPKRLAVVGPNGCGKTTLLRLAAGELEPTAGSVRRLDGRVVMLDQYTDLLDPEGSVLDNFQRLNPYDDESRCRTVLAGFLFRAEAARVPVRHLSGGERLRAGLACVLGGQIPPRLVVLDEPTNHLDLDSIGAMERALAAYDGALLVASHDEDFLAALRIDRRFELHPGLSL